MNVRKKKVKIYTRHISTSIVYMGKEKKAKKNNIECCVGLKKKNGIFLSNISISLNIQIIRTFFDIFGALNVM